jgi:hypothetical protein
MRGFSGFGQRLLAACFALSLCSCLEFSHSVIDPPGPFDARLLGTWETTSGDETWTMLFEEASPLSLRLTMRDVKKCKTEIYELIRTEINGRGFLQLRQVPGEVKVSDTDATFPAAYDLLDGNRLEVYVAEDDPIRAAVERGELAGSVTDPGRLQTVRVTASTDELRRFFAAHPETIATKLMSATRATPRPKPECASKAG